MQRPLVAVVVLAAALAGCAEEPQPLVAVKATATNGVFMSPLNYEGQVRPLTGQALVDVDAVENTGTVRVQATAGNDTYDVTWTRFAAAQPFHDGGIATQFREHGGSGVGDTSIPEVHLIAAGWGEATVTRNGQALADPVTGRPAWSAHFMITDTGVVGADGRIQNSAGGAYNPANAADGRTEPGDLELHVVLRNGAGPAANLTPVEIVQAAQGPVAADTPVPVPDAARANVTLFIRPGNPPVPPVAQLALSLKDAAGNEVATLTNQPGMPAEITVEVAEIAAGEWTLSATGTGAATAYGVRMDFAAPTSAQLYFVFEDVTLG